MTTRFSYTRTQMTRNEIATYETHVCFRFEYFIETGEPHRGAVVMNVEPVSFTSELRRGRHHSL